MSMKNTNTALILWGCQLLYILFVPVWFMTAMMSGILVDGPPANGQFGRLMLYVLIWIYPFVGCLSALFGWLTYHLHKFKAARIFNGLPMLWVLSLSYVFLFVYR